MASSSTSYANKNYNVFDIFINHRGPDCKKPFATDLYNRLCKHGLRPFLDIEELREGDGLTCQIEGAIQTASVHIAIFSPRYAESDWCLKELVLMLKSKAPIIPVFYHVQPSELRWTQRETGLYARVLRMLPWVFRMLPWFLRRLCSTRGENGVYARSLRELGEKKTIHCQTGKKEPRYDPSIIKEWRDALFNVADISGFDLESYNGDEQQLLEKIVEEVLKRVPRKLHVSKYPIALEQKIEDFEREMCLQQQSEQTRVIGIVGLGGVGKTTLAKQIFNRRRSHFNRSCFLFDVRDKPLISLQSHLLNNLAQWNGQISSSDEGIEMLGRYLAVSKALIILDDVDHIQQMNALLSPAKDALPSGSLILVTSRNMDVLVKWGIVESSIYRLTGLDPQQSKELFCCHTFHQSHPHVGFEKVVSLFLKTCDGLPLSLMVLGAHMHGQTQLKYWEAELRKISKVLPTDIHSRLKISYGGLDQQQKNIFLDIACFFLHKDRDTAIRIWDGSGWEGELGFRNLQDRCLVEVDEKNQIRMHDHLRDMGRDLAEKEPPDSWRRIWRPTDNLLYQHSPVRGVSVVPSDGPEWCPQHFKSLVESTGRLQLLAAEGDCVESILHVAQPPELIWLRWINCPYSSLPSWILMKNLRVLHIKGKKFETIWADECQAPVQIRELEIDGRVLIIPKSIEKLNYLEKIVLHNSGYESVGLNVLPDEFCRLQSLNYLKLYGCSEIKSLPASFGSLKNLQTLDLYHCSQLQSLPESLGGLTSLGTLDLCDCSQLQSLPESLGSLKNLQTLDLSHCSQLQSLPESLGGLTSLGTLSLYGCSQLQSLPESLGGLTSLATLSLYYCYQLQRLPESLGGLTSLGTLDLCDCSQLQRLPESLGGLTSLGTLSLECCSQLQSLPESLGGLTSLGTLSLDGCSQLQSLPESLGGLTSLGTLSLDGCSQLQSIPESLGGLTSLGTLRLDHCYHLQSLPESLGGLTSLGTLNLDGCSQLQSLPESLGGLTSLGTLSLDGCSQLQSLPESLGGLTSLRTLNLGGCSQLQSIPESLGGLTSLGTLRLDHCYQLQSLPESLGGLMSLETLYLDGCSQLQSLPESLGGLTSLRTLHMNGCSQLQSPPESLGGLTSLEALDLEGCSQLQSLPESLGGLTSLETLKMKDCNGLVEVGAFPTNLRTLELENCHALKKIGGVSGVSKLQMLNTSWCMELEELPSFETLVSLEDLCAFNCLKLKSLQGLEHSTKLRKLNINWCMELEELPSLETLVSLEELSAFNCVKLKGIHGLERLTELQKLNISGCIKLEELPSIERLVSLKELCAFNCVKLKRIQGLEPLSNLQTLNINGCIELEELPNIERLVSLQEVWAFNCVKLKNIQGLEHLTELQTLNIDGCMELEELPCIETLVSLERLAARKCCKLKGIPGLAQLTELQLLDVRGCSELEHLAGVEQLGSLDTLYASGCPKLRWYWGVVEELQQRLKEDFIV